MFVLGSQEKKLKFLSFLSKRKASLEQPKEKKYVYYKMGCPIDVVLDKLNVVYKEVSNSDVFKNLRVKSLDEDRVFEDFVFVFNRALLAGYDPYQPIDLDEVSKFPKTTFVGYLYGRPVGFIIYTIEERDGKNVGVIAGIGVIPEYRGRGVAKSLVIKTAEEMKKRFNVEELECDVYEKNIASINLVSKFGFKKIGEFTIG